MLRKPSELPKPTSKAWDDLRKACADAGIDLSVADGPLMLQTATLLGKLTAAPEELPAAEHNSLRQCLKSLGLIREHKQKARIGRPPNTDEDAWDKALGREH